MKDLLSVRRLPWLGHTSRMSGDRIPKKLLFGWRPQTQHAMEPSLGGETK